MGVLDYLSAVAGGGMDYLGTEGGSGGGGGGATDVTAAVAGDFLARIKEAADAGYRLSIGLDSDGQPVLVLGSGAAIDSRIKRTAAKTITVDDGAGGAVTLNVIGTAQQGGAALLTRTAADALYAAIGGGGAVFAGARVTNTAGTSIPNNTPTVIPFATEDFDTDGFHSTVTNNTRLTIPAGKDGYYLLIGNALVGGTSGDRFLNWWKNGTDYLSFSRELGSLQFGQGTSTIVHLVAGDYVELRLTQASGGAQPLDTTPGVNFASIVLIGGAPASAVSAHGGFAIQPLDRTTMTGLDATYGDDFDGASLNARWTRVTQGSGEETYQKGPRASALRVAYNTGAATRYIYQAAPAGDWTFETCLSNWQPLTTGQMFGLLALDTSGNGVAALLYDNPMGLYLANVTAGAYVSGLTSQQTPVESRGGRRVWLRLRKASGAYAVSYSIDGENYSPEISGTPTAFTLARVGIGRLLGTDAADVVDWHWFDKTA